MVSSGNRMLTVNTKPHSAEPRCNEPPYIRSFAYNDLSGFVSHNFFCISNLNTLALTTKQLLNIVTVSEKTMQWCNQTRQVVLLWVLKFQFFIIIFCFLYLKAFTWPYLQRTLDTGDRQAFNVCKIRGTQRLNVSKYCRSVVSQIVLSKLQKAD